MGRKLVLLGVLLAALFPSPSHAYLDPTSGSLLLQLLLGGVAGAALAIKIFWGRISGWFRGGKRDHEDPPA